MTLGRMSVSSNHVASLVDGLATLAENKPAHLAISYGKTEFTYRELDQITSHLANALHATGFKQGDLAALFLNNSTLHNIITQYGVWKAGGVLLFIEPTITARQLYPWLKQSGANTAFVSTEYYDLFKRAQSYTSVRRVVVARASDHLSGTAKWWFRLRHARRGKHHIEQHYADMRWRDLLKLGAKAPEVNVSISAETAALHIDGRTVSHQTISLNQLDNTPAQFQAHARYHQSLQRGQSLVLTPDF